MIDIKSFNSLIELTDAFPTEEVCLKYLESLIWEDGVVSPFDPESKVYVCSNNRYICKTQVNHSMLKREQSLRTQSCR